MEQAIFAALKSLVANRVYPDTAPASAVRPFIIWQQVGGQAVNFLAQVQPDKRNARVQVACWADTRAAADALALAAETALRTASALQTTVLGAPLAAFEPVTRLYGTMQDFSLWY